MLDRHHHHQPRPFTIGRGPNGPRRLRRYGPEDARQPAALEAALWAFATYFPEYVLIERSQQA